MHRGRLFSTGKTPGVIPISRFHASVGSMSCGLSSSLFTTLATAIETGPYAWGVFTIGGISSLSFLLLSVAIMHDALADDHNRTSTDSPASAATPMELTTFNTEEHIHEILVI